MHHVHTYRHQLAERTASGRRALPGRGRRNRKGTPPSVLGPAGGDPRQSTGGSPNRLGGEADSASSRTMDAVRPPCRRGTLVAGQLGPVPALVVELADTSGLSPDGPKGP